ncbi:MAG: hypothetical protein ACW967_03635 [Candidatus Hodarchaeales archaeon]|jgi:hypothetical protein
MAIKIEDLEENNWLFCQSCKNLCKNPNYDNDLRIDECCHCSNTNAYCSACYKRKKEFRLKYNFGLR